jgi:hypothetical protein
MSIIHFVHQVSHTKDAQTRLTTASTIYSMRLSAFHHPRPVLQRFRQVGGLDVLAGQVSDGACQLEHAVVGAPRKL